ncbi:disease resistance protein At4g27190-like [Rosa rugosa]|uniref:disease resistance protein At4g27190-like n=1 Tax=Rosa rugosa TaxID=74645 RepID=UPI002B411001|nr:disease resistance protein At4g27190-like [Rosa rugosa]
MQEIIVAFVEPLAEWTVRPICRQLSYVFHYDSNIEHLTRKVQELRDKRERVNLEMKPAREASQIIGPGVDRWLGDVDKIIQEKETSFSEETVAGKTACCNGWLPNLKCRHSLGRKAKKMTDEVDKLLANEPRTIAHPALHPEVEFQPTEDLLHEGGSSSEASNQEQLPACEGKNINFDSRRSTIRDVMEALKGNQFNPIIICGMGGIGKTTLMGQIFEKAKEEGLFDEYTKATIKESLDKAPDVIQIQGELAEYLGKKILEDEKERGPRASKLRQRLSQGNKKILVMLDNVSTTTSDLLWEIGIPPSCKLLVTSRQQDLFKDMDRRKNFSIDGLPDRDAWSLFKKTAGSAIESDLELHVVAEKVLEECAGLPIAISTIGTALKGESIAIWKNALKELEKANPENVPGVIEHVYGKIKFSYECLRNEEAKSCFLLCCIFEESADIPIEDLVRYGLGLELFKGIDSMVEGRNRMETLVQTLKSRFLLLDSDDKPEFVRMHDVVHDVAVYIASEEFVEKKNDGVEKRIVVRDKAKTVKLMDWPAKNSVAEKSTYCTSLSIKGLCRLLLLRTLPLTGIPLEPPPTILSRMKDITVLVIESMSPLSLLPSLPVLKNLHTLCLDVCDLKCDVSIIGELRTLVILSLCGSDIEQLPDTFKNLSNLRFLDLSICSELKIIPPGVISSLSRLEELYMWHSFEDWVVEKLASIETTNWISQLEAEERVDESEEVDYRETSLDTWKRFNRLAVEQPANIGNQFRKEVQGLDRANDEHTRWANSMDWKTGILAELLSLSHLTTLEVVLPPVNKLLTSNLFNKLERFKIFIGWKQHILWDLKHDGNYLRVHDLDGSAVMGGGITLLLKKTSILEFRMKNLTEPQALNVLDTMLMKLTMRTNSWGSWEGSL